MCMSEEDKCVFSRTLEQGTAPINERERPISIRTDFSKLICDIFEPNSTLISTGISSKTP